MEPDAVPAEPGGDGGHSGPNVCPVCAGTGRIGETVCGECAGSGIVEEPIGDA